jgi:hypothetical protein
MRKNISFGKGIKHRADEIIKVRGFKGLSELLSALVREEYERRTPPIIYPTGQETGIQRKILDSVNAAKSKGHH